MDYVTLGRELLSGQDLTLGDIERRAGLYILGKPGMGKSSLLVNLIRQDLVNGQSVFFLDPHGDGITDFMNRCNIDRLDIANDPDLQKSWLLFDPEYETHSFGINLLSCRNIASLKEREATYTRAYNVFAKIWDKEKEFGPWLQLIHAAVRA